MTLPLPRSRPGTSALGSALGFASALGLLLVLGSAAWATPQTQPSMPEMRLLAEDGTRDALRVGPIQPDQLAALRLEGASAALTVHTLEDDHREAARLKPPVLGTWRVEDTAVIFEPRFPWVRDQTYLVRWRPPTASPDQAVYEQVLVLPSTPPDAPATVVREIFPSTAAVPENLLKIYLQFSGPMTRGVARHHLHLWREVDSGEDEPVTAPFVAPEHELWNPAGDRLTLLFDPGRLKRGVAPNAALGSPLQAGQRVRLEVDGAWPDASGRPLGEAARRRWQVLPSDRTVPQPNAWRLTPPSSPSAPLTVHFDEPLDVALLQHALTVHGQDGEALDGDVVVDSQEQRWRFTPHQPWLDLCGLQLHVHSVLEDLAGNRTFRRFDEPMGIAPREPAPAHGKESTGTAPKDGGIGPTVLHLSCNENSKT